MNPHEQHTTSLLVLARDLWRHRYLTLQLARREVVGRYRGSVMGLAWSFFHPLIMLTIYTFVFSVVFKTRWGVETEGGQAAFAVILFAGMIVHGLFAEVLNRTPSLIFQNANYVKRVIFPLEVLPLTTLISALFHTLISLAVLLLAIVVLRGQLHWTVLFVPVVLLPLIMLSLGVAWFLAALGVYVRDVGQVMGVVATVLLFVSPVFFPLSAMPPAFQQFMLLNPLTFIIEQLRAVLLFGQLPNATGLGIYLTISMLVLWLGFSCFQKMRKGFADVL
jgi:lipopolysaccharide transport system permease protein